MAALKQHVLWIKGILSNVSFKEKILFKVTKVDLFLNLILLFALGVFSIIPVFILISSIVLAVSIKLKPVASDRTFKLNWSDPSPLPDQKNI